MGHQRLVSWLASLIHLATAQRWVLVSRLEVHHQNCERGRFEVLNTMSVHCLVFLLVGDG